MSDSAIRRIQVRKSASRSRHAPGDIEEYVATFFRLLRRVAEHSIPARRPKCDEHGAGERTLLTFDKQQNANAARAPHLLVVGYELNRVNIGSVVFFLFCWWVRFALVFCL